MKKVASIGVLVGWAVLTSVAAIRLHAAAPAHQGSTAPSAQLETLRPTLNRYCVSCHSERLRTAGLSLEKIDLGNVSVNAQVWEKVVSKLRTRSMPPPPAQRPDAATYESVATALEGALDKAAESRPNPGRPAVHRLNRAEYTNAIRDLLALDIDSRSLLPADDQGFGFDNNADLLTMSPGLLDRYMSAARKISRLAVGDPAMGPSVETYTVSRLLMQDDRMSEELPFGSRGGIVVRHHFPVDAQYVLRVRVLPATLRGAPEQVDVRLDGERLKLFTVGGQRAMAERPAVPEPNPPLEIRFAAKAGPRSIGVALVKKASVPEGLGPARLPVGSISFRDSGIAAVDVDGPYNSEGPGDTPSRQRIFTCRPAGNDREKECVERILAALARRAYRRPVVAKDIGILTGFYDAHRSSGFEAGIQAALERILIDPEFLFRVERDPQDIAKGSAYRLSDAELASRLSFFLWSSIPDEDLLAAVVQGKLRDPAVLERQVRRMLADPRADALVVNFAAQWLYLRNMRAVAPDASQFPEFDDNLRQAFQRETELFVGSQMREDRSVVDLLSANYTFVNERLAHHYGIPNVYGSHFRRVAFENGARGGLLGQGSILTVTSYATRTSPVLRGKWLLENVLGAPPPAPPPDVPALKENNEGGKAVSIRERMEEHRSNPVCASCHSRMDPLGFALENFDAIGKWRDVGEDNAPVDSSGSLPDGTTFRGPEELRGLLLSRRNEFVATVADKLLAYALGRGTEYYDRPALRKILRDGAGSDSRWSSLVLGIVKSTPFQMRMRRSEP